MAAPPVAAEAAFLGSVSSLTRRVEIYQSDGTTLWMDDDRLIDGSVSVDYSRDERRSFDLTLDNSDFGIIHSPNGLWYDKIFKIYSGINYRDSFGVWQSWECQIGEFLIDSVSQAHFPYTVKVAGRDYTKKLLVSKFTQATSFPKGQAIETTIKTIALNAGITKFLLPLTGKNLGTVTLFERGTSRWEAMKGIADAFGYELYFDAQGYLVLKEYADPVLSPLSYSFSTGPLGNLAGYEKSLNDTRLYNHIVVTGESSDSDTIPVSAEAKNTLSTSPTNISKIGDRVYQYTSSFITTTAQAQDVANKFLKIYALEEFDLNFEAIALPWLEAGSIVEFIDPRPAPDQPTRFLLSSLNLPLGLGAMSANAKRVSIVG